MGKMFWEDIQQASERLNGTYILYGDKVVIVDRCDIRDGNPSALVVYPKGEKSSEWLALDDPKFHDFHRLPPMGYVNVFYFGEPRAVYLERLPERSRAHGLKNGRIAVYELLESGPKNSSKLDFSRVVSDDGYAMTTEGVYPTAREIIDNLPAKCSAALSPTYAISRDAFGAFRLYRRQILVGVIMEDVVKFSRTTDCYREELTGMERFNIKVEG